MNDDLILDDIIKMENGVLIPKESTDIHHVTQEMSENQGILIKKAIIKFAIAMEKANILVAHNIEFDKKMVQDTVPLVEFKLLYNKNN